MLSIWENWTIHTNRQIKLNLKNKTKKEQKSYPREGPFLSSQKLLKHSCAAKHAEQLKSRSFVSGVTVGNGRGPQSHTGARSAPSESLQVFVGVSCSGLLTSSELHFCAARAQRAQFFIRKSVVGAKSVKCFFMFQRNANINTTVQTWQPRST